MVFIEEEKETALEQQMNKKEDLEYSNSGSLGSHFVPGRLAEKGGSGLAVDVVSVGESELAVKKSVLSVAAGDRINEALELADGELAEILSTKKSNKARVARGEKEMPIRSNPLLLGMEPARYVLWVLRSVNVADLEQALMILPLIKVERLIFYLIYLIKSNLGVELCGKIAVFLVKVHQKQVSFCVFVRAVQVPVTRNIFFTDENRFSRRPPVATKTVYTYTQISEERECA